MADAFVCVEESCQKTVTATKNGRYRTHKKPDGQPCRMSSEEIPVRETQAGPVKPGADPGVPEEGRDFAVCKECGRKVKLTRLGYLENHDKTLRGADRCPMGGTRWRPKIEDVVPDLPEVVSVPPTGVTPVSADSAPERDAPGRAFVKLLKEELRATELWTIQQPAPWIDPMENPEPTESFWPSGLELEVSFPLVGSTPSPESVTTSKASREPESTPSPTARSSSMATSSNSRIQQPGTAIMQPPDVPEDSQESTGSSAITPTAILQPTPYEGPVKAAPMTEEAAKLAERIKETFYAYSNRKTKDNRSAQTTLGPSEIGTPCDRRLAMALLGVVPVNPGGDGWASFVGTWGHVGMSEVYTFADAGTGRYAVEMPVFLGIPTVPRGTADLLDRRDATIIDWKFMGKYSLDKFKKEGPSQTYEVQADVYGLGAERGGEKVRNVAIVGLPRAGRSLDEMHVWVKKYDRKNAQKALDRVERIAGEVNRMYGEAGVSDAGPQSAMEAAATFDTADDCYYCDYYLKGDKEMTKGCPGS
jgi:hypothetical protein